MGYRLLAAVCMLIGYGFFGKRGTVYFENFNLGVTLVYLIYWLLFSGSFFQLTSFHYYRFGSRKRMIKQLLWRQCKQIAGYTAAITALLLCLSLVYAQPFTVAEVLRFYLLSVVNLWLLVAAVALIRMQYGSTAASVAYMCIVAGNVLLGWTANGAERFALLTFPFMQGLHISASAVYLLAAAILGGLYIGYCRNDLK